jgi:hypothetical protein
VEHKGHLEVIQFDGDKDCLLAFVKALSGASRALACQLTCSFKRDNIKVSEGNNDNGARGLMSGNFVWGKRKICLGN